MQKVPVPVDGCLKTLDNLVKNIATRVGYFELGLIILKVHHHA